jgi:hypothetical protein
VLNAACDITGTSSGFVAALGPQGLDLEVAVGPENPLRNQNPVPAILTTENRREVEGLGPVFVWDGNWLLPLHSSDSDELIGLIGIRSSDDPAALSREQTELLQLLGGRVVEALKDRTLQREVFAAVDRLSEEVGEIQRLRAAARYGGVEALGAGPLPSDGADMVAWVREALSHYWGGPRLTSSPLLGLEIVRQAVEEQGGNPVNGLREVLRRGIERVRPEGERRFTAEWMLYNILEMKFLEGRKVRDIAMRLAMSEADLYRKQRVAIEAVARAIGEMEREALEGPSPLKLPG